jgi:hypothetical protein
MVAEAYASSCSAGGFGSITGVTWRGARDIAVRRFAGKLLPVRHLSVEEQVFVLYQIRNWLIGRDGAFKLLNDAPRRISGISALQLARFHTAGILRECGIRQ